MSAAITAKEHHPELRVCILEKNSDLGKKLYATGNGKCNLSNLSCKNPMDVYKFFDSIGIFTRTDEAGRLYPNSEQAADVVAALINALKRNDVEVKCGITILSVEKKDDTFEIQIQDDAIRCRNLLLSTGGKAGPQYGNLGEGYAYAKALGHSVDRTYPVLSPLECRGDFVSLKGIRSKGRICLMQDDRPIATEDGEIQFSEDGLSGICVFNLSRFIRLNPKKSTADAFAEYSISIDFVPHQDQRELENYLMRRASRTVSEAGQLLTTIVHKRLGEDILKRLSIEPKSSASSLTMNDVENIAGLLKNWRCGIQGVKGWKKAQCTGGGVPFDEIDEESYESRIVSGLYIVGELLDYDGPSGGYNLHFAWESGIRAGKAIANDQV
jgi:predicted Rossmann fold flavoprotein